MINCVTKNDEMDRAKMRKKKIVIKDITQPNILVQEIDNKI